MLERHSGLDPRQVDQFCRNIVQFSRCFMNTAQKMLLIFVEVADSIDQVGIADQRRDWVAQVVRHCRYEGFAPRIEFALLGDVLQQHDPPPISERVGDSGSQSAARQAHVEHLFTGFREQADQRVGCAEGFLHGAADQQIDSDVRAGLHAAGLTCSISPAAFAIRIPLELCKKRNSLTSGFEAIMVIICSRLLARGHPLANLPYRRRESESPSPATSVLQPHHIALL